MVRGNEDPIGRHFGRDAGASRAVEIVGIAKEARSAGQSRPSCSSKWISYNPATVAAALALGLSAVAAALIRRFERVGWMHREPTATANCRADPEHPSRADTILVVDIRHHG